MSWFLTLPLAIPFATAVLAGLSIRSGAGRWVSLVGMVAQLLSALFLLSAVSAQGVISGQMGGWPAPFGITLVADHLSAVLVTVTAAVGLAVAVYAVGEIEDRLERLGYHALFNILIAGVTGSFLTGDIFNLYVWFEVMLIASFGLLILGGSKAQIDGGVRYVALNLVSTVLFLTGIGLLYGMTGTLNMADLAGVADTVDPGLLTVIAMLFLVAFGVKAAIFPLFFWLPASYHTPAYAVSAVFAGLLTKVGAYALIRTFTLIFDHDAAFTQPILMWVAGLTMVVGVLGAAAQTEVRKLLSFTIVSGIGYILLGLSLGTQLGMTGGLFYLVHTMIVTTGLFLIAGVMERVGGSSYLGKVGGLYGTAPVLATLFFITAFSLAGFPPLSGFWPKFLLVKASLDISAVWLAVAALVTGLLTIFVMTRIWGEAFWTPHPEARHPRLTTIDVTERRLMLAPIAALMLATVLLGLLPQPLIGFLQVASDQLLDPAPYIAAVLGETP